MGAKADVQLVLLWESELRAAGEALRQANETGTQEDWAKAMGVCLTALHGVGNDGALVLIAADTIRAIARKRKCTNPETPK